jgi:hypothetical protein
MSSKNLSARLAVFALVVSAGSASAYGCSSSNNNNPAPSTNDSGSDSTSSSSSGSSSGGSSDGSMNDSVVIDTGACMSDASTCNSCYTPMQAQEDPLNACAPETANCIPFTQTVPTHPML